MITLRPPPPPPPPSDDENSSVSKPSSSYQVGVTSLVGRFVHNKWPFHANRQAPVDYHRSTIDLYHSTCNIDDTGVFYTLIDVDGHCDLHWNHLRKMKDVSRHDAAGIVFVYDITNAGSWRVTKELVEQALGNRFYDDVEKLLLGNKSDREEEREVEYLEAKSFAEKNGLNLVEVSAKEGTNVEFALTTFMAQIVETIW